MPTIARADDDRLDALIEDAGLEEWAAVQHERAGRFEKGALALRRAQAHLRDAELLLLGRARRAADSRNEPRGSESPKRGPGQVARAVTGPKHRRGEASSTRPRRADRAAEGSPPAPAAAANGACAPAKRAFCETVTPKGQGCGKSCS